MLIPEVQTRLMREAISLTASLTAASTQTGNGDSVSGVLSPLISSTLGLKCFLLSFYLPVWAYCKFSQLLGVRLVKTAMQWFLHKEREIYNTWMKAKEHKA